jgi:methyl-accepting chemotaxis protein
MRTQRGRLTIGKRIALTMAVPILALVISVGSGMRDRLEDVRAADMLKGHVEMAAAVSIAVHELQRERGASAGFIGSKGAQLGDQLTTQRRATDAVLAPMRGALERVASAMPEDMRATLRSVERNLGELAAKRQAVSALTIPAAESTGWYTATIDGLITVVSGAARLSTHHEISEAISALVTYMRAKEMAGLERATGTNAFAAGKFGSALYVRFISILSEQDTWFRAFASHADARQIDAHRRIVAGGPVDEALRLRRAAVEAGAEGALGMATAPQWFAATTARIDLLKKVEDQLAADIVARVETLRDAAVSALWVMSTVLAAAIGIGFALAWLAVRTIAGPVRALTGYMGQLAAGDTTQDVPGRARGDEVGRMAAAVEVFREGMAEADRLRGAQEEARRNAEADRVKLMRGVADEFETAIGGVVATLTAASADLERSSSDMSTAATTATREADMVTLASGEAASSFQTVATAAEQLSASVQEIGRQVAAASSLTTRAVAETGDTTGRIAALSEAANRIGDVVRLISDIAGQTNLLALNATIEAARAGEAGKGFAVVASEVKALATQTAKATDEIGAQITSIQDATRETVEAIDRISGTIRDVNEVSTAIAAAVEEQQSATSEIARGVQQASAQAEIVSTNVVGLSRMAHETGAVSSQVRDASAKVAGESGRLGETVQRLVSSLRR